mmetsp:Transcript_571/g.998  ORF Transcript_571/g.998 Transcript_571/m.998 type:complete len:402 (-) Transcript_571:330-1535(-)
MTFLGEKNDLYETVIFSILAAVSFVIMLIQVLYLQKLKSLSVRVLPLLTLLVSYENACSAAGDAMSSDSIFANFSVIVIATILPLFFVVLFELPFRLHEARSAHFMCIPFEQGEVMYRSIALASLVSVRVFALGIFVVNALVNLDLLKDENSRAGLGGYANAKEELESVHFWLSIVPSVVLALLALFISVLMQRYARNFTLGIRNSNHYWRYMLPCSILYTVGQSFGAHIYRWTSLTGDVFLVIGISIMVHRVQSDLAVAGSFADFLHRSNAVFRTSATKEGERKSMHAHAHTHQYKPSAQSQESVQTTSVTRDEVQISQMENGDLQVQAVSHDDITLVSQEQEGHEGTEGVDRVVEERREEQAEVVSTVSTVPEATSTALVKGELKLDSDGDEMPEMHAL